MISTNPIEKFRKKFDVVSLFVICNGKILMLKRQINKPHEKTWGPPAGKVDKGESIEQAICRETFEESGLKIQEDQITKHQKSYFVRHGNIDFMFYVFAVKIKNKPEIILRTIEHSEHAWFTPQETLEIDLVQDEDVVIRNYFLED